MKKVLLSIAVNSFLLLHVFADTAYVDINSTNPVPPYSSWATAATNIASPIGLINVDTVLVTNGHYLLSSEIQVNADVTIQSVHGDDVTLIDGGGSYRCFNISSSSCIIDGFTITNGYADYGGGIQCADTAPLIKNCTFSKNRATYFGGGISYGTVSNCQFCANSASRYGGAASHSAIMDSTITGNSAAYGGGGTYYGTAERCEISDNRGGGVYYGIVNYCTIKNNSSDSYGGGLSSATANYCIISGNYAADEGGGLYQGTANGCTIRDNSGGGSFQATLYNCAVSGNSGKYSGGVRGGTANNCTITGNSAAKTSGGTTYATVTNCIIWNNNPADLLARDIDGGKIRYSCSPDLTHGTDGNITNNPLLVSISHIAENSPCRGVGTVAGASGTDIDGEAWLTPPAMGCDEFYSAGITGELSVAIVGVKPVLAGVPTELAADITGQAGRHEWSFGDGTVVTNQLYAHHAWAATGVYEIVLTAYNLTYPGGVAATQSVNVVSSADVCIYVSKAGDDANNGSSWAAAKATIQAGINAQEFDGGIVYISNGTYNVSAEIVVDKDIIVKSINGPETTFVDAGGSCRCFNLGISHCRISGLTLAHGYYYSHGGGVYCSDNSPMLENCIITQNRAESGAGMCFGSATNCTFSCNYAGGIGGAVDSGIINNCILVANTAEYGGGMHSGTINNSVISGNTAREYGGGLYMAAANNCTFVANQAGGSAAVSGGPLTNCIAWFNRPNSFSSGLHQEFTCAPETASSGTGNITDDPLLRSASHIATNSPCVGAGTNLGFDTDIDGDAWLNPPSMGCDEKNPGDVPAGKISFYLVGPKTVATGYVAYYRVIVIGDVDEFRADFGGGYRVTNTFWVSTSWDTAGTFDVVLSAFNSTYPAGICSTQSITVVDSDATAIYVAISGDDANNGSSWASAKATIQAGINAQNLVGGIVLVNDGTYMPSSVLNIDKDIRLQSFHGAESTIVDGGGTNGCFNLHKSFCVVRGFTITRGNRNYGGGIHCDSTDSIIESCIISNNVTAGGGGGIYRGTAVDCLITHNLCSNQGGGGTEQCILKNCTVSYNESQIGGGIRGGSAADCLITGNISTLLDGGGAQGASLSRCTVSSNSTAANGGGADECSVYYSTVIDNTAGVDGGGLNDCTILNCVVGGNYAERIGGGANEGSAVNSSFCGNYSEVYGGGTYATDIKNCTTVGNISKLGAGNYGGGVVKNCITWHNKPDNFFGSVGSVFNSCAPDITAGEHNNITDNPLLASATHITTNSPCRGTGNAGYTSGTDIDGDDWQDPPSMGCDEKLNGQSANGDITILMNGLFSIGSGFTETYQISVIGNVSKFSVDFGNRHIVENEFLVENQWDSPGTYKVVITAWNDDYPGGIRITKTVHVFDSEASAIYVSPAGSDTNDGSSWASAKATIQAGVDAQTRDTGLVLLSDGTFLPAAAVTVNKRIKIRSLHGYDHTTIDGGGSTGGFTLGSYHCIISGLTITNCISSAIVCDDVTPVIEYCLITGNSGTAGAGINQGTANYCTIVGNTAGTDGGGICKGNASHCIIRGNTATTGGGINFKLDLNPVNYADFCLICNNTADFDGGTSYGILNNCTVVSNKAIHAGSRTGGCYAGMLRNCIIWYNTSVQINQDINESLEVKNCCTPAYSGGVPGFVGGGDYHLADGSQCIDGGSSHYLYADRDLDDTPIPLDGDTNGVAAVDIGCYEFINAYADTDKDGLTDADEIDNYNTDPTSDNTDRDEMNDGDEIIAGTDPLNPDECFKAAGVKAGGTSTYFTVYFDSLISRQYQMLSCSNLTAGSWQTVPGCEKRAGINGMDSMQDTNQPPYGPFYKIQVENP